MRRSKEIVVLLGLLVGAVGFVLWYVADRRARQQAAPRVEPRVVGPAAPAPVDLTKADGHTVDFSSGRPVVRKNPEDEAAIAAAKKDMDAALAEVSFEPAKPPGK
ncbi:MAG TPA: hypothetical protein VEB66_17315 [Opitutaceae bacterium]|nr:hypothetical protein [Opitutaceae bacterium]